MHRRWTLCGAALAVFRAGALSAGMTTRTEEDFLRQVRDARDRSSALAAAVRFGNPVRFDKTIYSCSDLAGGRLYAAPGDTIYATFVDRIPDGGGGERRVTATASIRR